MKLDPQKPQDKRVIDQVQDLLFTLAFNIKLKDNGICPKYIFEMDDKDERDYVEILGELNR